MSLPAPELVAYLRALLALDLPEEANDHLRRMAVAALPGYMRELSEEYWSASWLIDLEYELYYELTQSSPERCILTFEELDTLRMLAEIGGCWIVNGPTDDEPQRLMVTREAWEAMYEPWAVQRVLELEQRAARIAACEADGGHDWALDFFGGLICACGAHRDPFDTATENPCTEDH